MKNIKLIICVFASAVACKEVSDLSGRSNAAVTQKEQPSDPDMNPFMRKDFKSGAVSDEPETEEPATEERKAEEPDNDALLTKGAAGENSADPFTAEMKTLDSLFYTGVYNNRDTTLARKLIHEDFEFYHDRIGVLKDQDSLSAAEIMIRRLHDIGNHYRRRLKPGTLRSYPLYNGKELYGAIQQGINLYHKTETGRLEGTGHFMHLWVKEQHQWKLKRVISYKHETVAQ